MAFLRPQARTARFNRFQTPAPGMTFVATAVNAHFDPYTEAQARVQLSADAMEQVARVAVDPKPGAGARK